MVKLLQQNPGVAIPVILSRLQQKDGEWRRIKDDMAPLWGKVSGSGLWRGRLPANVHATVPVRVHVIRPEPWTSMSPDRRCQRLLLSRLTSSQTKASQRLQPCMSGGCGMSSQRRAHTGHSSGAVPA